MHRIPARALHLAITLTIIAGIALLYPQPNATAQVVPSAEFALYLPLILGGSDQDTPSPTTTPPTTTPPDTSAFRAEVIRLVNEYRLASGCPAATEHPILMNAAQEWSDYMVAHDVIAHSNTVDQEWYTSRGYAPDARENIASGHRTPAEVVQAWKNSPAHNKTLLSCFYASQGATYDIGVGFSQNRWTLALGEPLP